MADYKEEIVKNFGLTIPELEKFTDTRDPELIQAHKVLARETFKFQTARTKEIIKRHPEWKIPPMPGTVFEYNTDVLTVGALFGIFITMQFYSDNYQHRALQFAGGGGGLGTYDSISRGTSWFYYPLETLLGWEARFEVHFLALGVSVNLWGMHGEYIGSYAGGGGAGIGVYGGQGKFLPP
jgi:hypothetical protein